MVVTLQGIGTNLLNWPKINKKSEFYQVSPLALHTMRNILPVQRRAQNTLDSAACTQSSPCRGVFALHVLAVSAVMETGHLLTLIKDFYPKNIYICISANKCIYKDWIYLPKHLFESQYKSFSSSTFSYLWKNDFFRVVHLIAKWYPLQENLLYNGSKGDTLLAFCNYLRFFRLCREGLQGYSV